VIGEGLRMERLEKTSPPRVLENSNVSGSSDYGGQRCYEN
jgi:hypothetical protein